MNLRKFPLLLVLIVLVVCLPPSSTYAQDAGKSSTPDAALTSQLTDIATASLHAQLEVLTNSVSASSASQSLSIYYYKAIQQKIADATVQRAALLAKGIVYGNYKLQFTLTDAQIDKDSATLQASAYIVIALDNAKTDPLAPQQTEYVDDHTFRFQQVNSAWFLTEDQILMPPNAEIDPQLGPVTGPSS